MGFDLSDISDFQSDLEHIQEAFGDGPEFRAIACKALEAGAEPVRRRMVANASIDPKVRTGTLRAALRIGKIKRTKNGTGYHLVIGQQTGTPEGVDAYYACMVEFGHGGPHGPAAPHPFVLPAYAETEDESYGIICDVLAGDVVKYLRRLR